MKKILAMMLTAAMMLSMGTAVFAEGEGDLKMETGVQTVDDTTINKLYTVNGATTADIFPAEILNFTATLSSAPDAYYDIVKDNEGNVTSKTLKTDAATSLLVTVSPVTVESAGEHILEFTLPSYTVAGTYKYTIAETPSNNQGVTYTNDTIELTVLVTYDYDDADGDDWGMEVTSVGAVIIDEATGAKDDTFTNTYELGNLKVNKQVTGNLAEKDDQFDVEVTFTSALPVKSNITYSSDIDKKNETILMTDWVEKDGEYTVSKPITLQHNETFTFIDIPVGIEYTVVESDEYQNGDKNTKNYGYDAPKYEETDVNEQVKDDGAGVITAVAETDTVKIINNKGETIETGISVDSIPYIAMLGVVAIGGTGFIVSKKRRSED